VAEVSFARRAAYDSVVRNLIVALICLSLMAAAAAPPPPPPPPTAPATTAPATAQVVDVTRRLVLDRSSPKAAAISLFKAITAGDREAVAAGFFAGNDEQRDLAEAMADVIVSGKKLGDAAKEKFGNGADPIGRGMLDPDDLSKLEDATVVETSPDAVVLTVPDQPRPMSFRRQAGEWKLVVTDFGGAAQQNIAKQTRLVRAMADAIEAAAGEIAANKYKTPEEAKFAIQQSLHQVMLSFYRPSTTRSATNPAATQSTTPSTPAATR
jgi:hypothetical protein